MSPSDLWNRALDAMSRDLKKSVFDTWIKSLRPVEEKESHIVLETSSAFQKEYIESHYAETIRQVLRRLTDRDIAVLFTIGRPKPSTFPTTLPNPPATTPSPLLREPFPEIRPAFLERFTFDAFVVGDSNRLAYNAALNVARQPGKAYNPLFIYGKRGLGKTHLLQAIGNHILAEKRPLVVRYASADEFGNDISQAVQRKDYDPLLRKYRHNDVLLLDDVNLLEGKEGFQNFFLHTFNALYMAGKQIVLTSDRPPRELKDIQPRIVNRWEQGLVAEIRSPDLATRQAILRHLCLKAGLPLPSNLIHYIAGRISHDVRELEGAVNRLVLEHRLDGAEFTREAVDRALAVYFAPHPASADSTETVIAKTAAFFGLSVDDLLSHRKTANVAKARHVAMYLCVERKTAPIVEIARAFRRSHSAVIHGHAAVAERLRHDINLKNTVDTLRADLDEGF